MLFVPPRGVITGAAAVVLLAGLSESAFSAGVATQPTICSRSCWGSRSTASSPNMAALNRAIVHHTAGSGDYTTSYETAKSKVRAVQNLHMDVNGWTDIGYHFLFSAGGHAFEGRRDSLNKGVQPRGAHDGANTNSFGFTCLGYYHTPHNQTLTEAQKNMLYDVIAWRMPSGWSPYGAGSYNGRTVGYVDGHRDVLATACPGDKIYNTIIGTNHSSGVIRHEINDRIKGTTGPTGPTYTTADYLWFGLQPATSGDNGQFEEREPVDIAGEYTPISGDFNGDGRFDIFWYAPGTATDRIRFGRATSNGADENAWFDTGGTVDVNGTYRPVSGDFNGDGCWDILWYGVGTNPDSLWLGRTTDAGGNNGMFNSGGTVEYSGDYKPVAGDFNGDGRDDLLLYGSGDNGDAVRWGRATHSGATQNGWFDINGTVNVSGTYRPETGDFNGDGRCDVFWYNPGTAQDYIWYGRATNAGGDNGWWDSYTTEFAGDYNPVITGDYNGDGKFDIFLYQRGTDGDFIRGGSATLGSWSTALGSVNVNGTYKPVSGDFDGDGKWDIFWHGPGS